MGLSKNFFYAKNLADVFYQMKTISELAVLGGGTSFVGRELPEKSLSVRSIAELRTVDKKERFIDLGAALTLSQIEELGAAHLPATLYDAVTTVANQNIRNLATIGGNICTKDFYHTLYAPLLALDAHIEIQKGSDTELIPITKFDSVPDGWILSKIRIPFEEWDVSLFRRLGPSHAINELSASFVFLAHSQKGQVSDLRLACAGTFRFRNRELENKLIGAHLPLSGTTVSEFQLEADEAFNAQCSLCRPILKKQFWNLVKYSLEQLT